MRRLTVSTASVVLLATLIRPATARAQDTTPTWLAGSLGYSGPGVSFAAEGWAAPGYLVLGLHAGEIARGYQNQKTSTAWSLLGGPSVPLGRLRISGAAGGTMVSFSEAQYRSGIYPVVAGMIDLPLSQHIGLHAEHFRVLGTGSGYTTNSFGFTIGNVRFR